MHQTESNQIIWPRTDPDPNLFIKYTHTEQLFWRPITQETNKEVSNEHRLYCIGTVPKHTTEIQYIPYSHLEQWLWSLRWPWPAATCPSAPDHAQPAGRHSGQRESTAVHPPDASHDSPAGCWAPAARSAPPSRCPRGRERGQEWRPSPPTGQGRRTCRPWSRGAASGPPRWCRVTRPRTPSRGRWAGGTVGPAGGAVVRAGRGGKCPGPTGLSGKGGHVKKNYLTMKTLDIFNGKTCTGTVPVTKLF